MLCDLRAPTRPRPTICQRVNPLWWLGDVKRPAGAGMVAWFFRNPCCNFLSVIVGIAHLARAVCVHRGSGWTFTDGVNYGYSIALGGWLPRPFVSFRAWGLEGMLGWKTSGGLGVSLRIANAKGPS